MIIWAQHSNNFWAFLKCIKDNFGATFTRVNQQTKQQYYSPTRIELDMSSIVLRFIESWMTGNFEGGAHMNVNIVWLSRPMVNYLANASYNFMASP